MNDYVFLILLLLLLILYLFFFKEKFIKWEERDSIGKSFSIRFIVILVVSIILWIYKIIKSH